MTLHISSVFTYDEDAGNYIQAVETADGQALESAVRQAINNFVIGCKQDGIWDAITDSCILAGARTLGGALQPLVGTAPTNNNFVDADYNRKTGLVGNKTDKYLRTGRNNNVSQDNRHLAVYVSDLASSHTQVLIGALPSTGSSSYLYRDKVGTTPVYKSVLAASTEAVHGSPSLGFFGAKRSAGTTTEARHNMVNYSNSLNSSSPGSILIDVFRANRSAPGFYYTDARIAFYSIGESLDLAKLDSRVTDLITAIGAAIP